MFSQLGVLAGYELNKDYISKVLCINRDKPEMHCNGQCYLKKKLQENQQRKDGENGTSANRMDVVLFCPGEKPLLQADLKSSAYCYPKEVSRAYCSPYFSFFHPPRPTAAG